MRDVKGLHPRDLFASDNLLLLRNRYYISVEDTRGSARSPLCFVNEANWIPYTSGNLKGGSCDLELDACSFQRCDREGSMATRYDLEERSEIFAKKVRDFVRRIPKNLPNTEYSRQ